MAPARALLRRTCANEDRLKLGVQDQVWVPPREATDLGSQCGIVDLLARPALDQRSHGYSIPGGEFNVRRRIH